MRISSCLVGCLLVAMVTGCSDSVSDVGSTPATSPTNTNASSTTEPTPAPRPEKTYVRAPGDPQTHTLHIRILDKGISYDPGSCRARRIGAAADTLALAAPDARFEYRPIDPESPIPVQAKRLADGRCSATMKLTVRYAPRYTGGIAREGKGMTTPDDPQGVDIVTRGTVQDVDLLNYPKEG